MEPRKLNQLVNTDCELPSLKWLISPQNHVSEHCSFIAFFHWIVVMFIVWHELECNLKTLCVFSTVGWMDRDFFQLVLHTFQLRIPFDFLQLLLIILSSNPCAIFLVCTFCYPGIVSRFLIFNIDFDLQTACWFEFNSSLIFLLWLFLSLLLFSFWFHFS